ncbi:MAG: tRNA (adenosine(37)-N6)-threonylcarbamoyltransferase complex transferase subunit TsaD [Eubacterium sp.]|nr:tRNA (adenosine(37)-N6)-threonylcarbamoyltransferase complex transferase subunit TsaD [Eubacterium sp.]
MEDIRILAIESSCDETAAAVVRNGREVLSNVISSQIRLHTLYGGVVPEIASRKHIEKIDPVIRMALEEAGTSLEELSAVAVTCGPGLVGALLVGVAEAKAIAYARKLPLIGVHHIEGHIAANYIEHPELEPPFLCEVISGGHTHLVIVQKDGELEILGRTRDDAAGEAFDKVARAIGLGYPGGPKIEKAAQKGDPEAIRFPRTHIREAGRDSHNYARGSQKTGPYDFSFSGLKSAVLNYLNTCRMAGTDWKQEDVAASFQAAVIEDLVETAMRAARRYDIHKFAIAGGVASNGTLRRAMQKACEENGLTFYYPSPIFCTDNAAMIGVAAFEAYRQKRFSGWDLNAVPNLPLGEKILCQKIQR